MIKINAVKWTWATLMLLVSINSFLLSSLALDQAKQLDSTIESNDELPLELNNKHQSLRRDFRWPNKQVNVLIDSKSSFNSSELLILESFFDQLESKTCLHINKLAADKINPFDQENGKSNSLNEFERNFIYIFKSQVGAYNRHPSLGLSSFGCTRQGRQSLVLTELAFRWPELVLRYHIMRSLGLENLERPDGPVRKLLNILPLSQKISNNELPINPAFMVTSSLAHEQPYNQSKPQQLMAKRLHLTLRGRVGATTADKPQQQQQQQQVINYLSEDDLNKIKELYNCSDYQNKLSPAPMGLTDQTTTNQQQNEQLYSQAKSLMNDRLSSYTNTASPSQLASAASEDEKVKKLDEAEESLERIIEALEEGKKEQINDTLIDDAAKHIVDYLLAETADDDNNNQQQGTFSFSSSSSSSSSTTTTTTTASSVPQQCSPMETCPLEAGPKTDTSFNEQQQPQPLQERPMLLKLDEFHAQDPHLKQANQMKLSQFSNDSLATYRLMGDDLQQQQQLLNQQPQFFQQQQQASGQFQPPKSEMLISFEQSNNVQPGQNAIDSLASSQVLKLCSCTCQTMKPAPSSTEAPLPSSMATTMGPPLPPQTSLPPVYPTYPPIVYPTYPTYPPVVYPTYPTTFPYYPTQRPTFPTDPNDYTLLPSTWPPNTNLPPLTSTESITTTEPTTTLPPLPPTTTTTAEPIPPETTTTTAPSTTPANINSMISNACQQVEWVKPNKTVYASAKIVWDVDRGNQNYFLCQNSKDGQLIPGKTHGFSCKVSSEGKAFEMHNFNVLIKPENVQLAWVQKTSNSFGKTNFPVIGGHSKTTTDGTNQDPYIVSRCLVKDENNDVITLIGYVNNQGVGWFPFDDIQIECSQYDVLACVN